MSQNNISVTETGAHVSNQPLTLEATLQASPELLMSDIDANIVKIRPSSTPLDQITRLAVPRVCNSMEVGYYSVDMKKTAATVTAEVTVDIATGSATKAISVPVDDTELFDVTDTVLFPGITNMTGDESELVGYVASVSGDTAINVVFVGDAVEAVIAKGARIVRMGRAAAELDVQTAQYQAVPVKGSNYCQIFKMQAENSTLHALAAKEVDWTLSDQEEAAIVDMRLAMEKSFLFGCKAKLSVPKKTEPVYLAGGIWNQCGQKMEVDVDSLSQADLTAICARAFTENNGSKERVMLCGTRFLTALSNIEAVRVVQGSSPMVKWGLVVREIVTNFGQLYVIHSEIFDQCGHSADAFIIDPAYVTKYVHIPFHAESLDLRSSGQRNTEAVVLTEASCLVLRYPKSHLKLIGKSAQNAGDAGE